MKCTNKDFKFSEIVCDCKLTHDKITGKYILYAPQYIKGKVINNRSKIVSLDPGEKSFMAFYGLDHIGMIGEDIRIKILEQEKNIRQSQRKLSKVKECLAITNEKERNEIFNKIKIKCRRKIKRIKKAMNKYYRKIKNIVKELHNKTALFLCKNYDIVLIPVFETQRMISNGDEIKKTPQQIKKNIIENSQQINTDLKKYKKKSVLNSRVKFVLNMLSHYKFRQHLLAKGEEYGCLIKVVTEEYTSVACGKCGKLSKKYSNRIKECTDANCKFKIDRDFNGSRLIMIKNIGSVRSKS